MDSLDIQVSAICTLLFWIVHMYTLVIQGGVAFKAGTRPPEDGKLGIAGKVPQGYGMAEASKDASNVAADDGLNSPLAGQSSNKLDVAKHKMEDARWRRILLNDSEHIPY